MIHRLILPLLLLLAAAPLAAQPTQKDRPSERKVRALAEMKLMAYTDALAQGLTPRVQNALKRIPSAARRLLAIKYYLHRDEEEILRKWAWSAEETRQFKASDSYDTAIAELSKVRAKFAELNPGYSLDVKMEVRTLGSQIGKWNSVRSIRMASNELVDTCLKMMTDTAVVFAPSPEGESLERFRGFLREFEPVTVPTVAVPGLSQHGQLRAFDFRIMRGRRLVAGTSTRTIPTDWDAPGWTAKLKEAITQASDRFEGPLDEPYEPWHYTYRQ